MSEEMVDVDVSDFVCRFKGIARPMAWEYLRQDNIRMIDAIDAAIRDISGGSPDLALHRLRDVRANVEANKGVSYEDYRRAYMEERVEKHGS